AAITNPHVYRYTVVECHIRMKVIRCRCHKFAVQFEHAHSWKRYIRSSATTSPIGCRRYSNSVITPKLPPPPRIAQKRSGLRDASAGRERPSAVTIRAERTLSQAAPYLREPS